MIEVLNERPVWSECSGCARMGRSRRSLWWAATSRCASAELSETSGLHTAPEQRRGETFHTNTLRHKLRPRSTQSFTHRNWDVSVHFHHRHRRVSVHQNQNGVKCMGYESLAGQKKSTHKIITCIFQQFNTAFACVQSSGVR